MQYRELLHWGAQQDTAWAGLPVLLQHQGRAEAELCQPWAAPDSSFQCQHFCVVRNASVTRHYRAVLGVKLNVIFYLHCGIFLLSSVVLAATQSSSRMRVKGLGPETQLLQGPQQWTREFLIAVPWQSPEERLPQLGTGQSFPCLQDTAGRKDAFFFGHISPSKPLPPTAPPATGPVGLL